MRLTLRISVDPTREQLQALGPAVEEGARAGLARGAEILAAGARDRIGREHPGEWQPLHPETVDAKRGRGQTGRVSATDPLLATGAMQRSITATADGDSAAVGSNDPNLRRHEQGTRQMPARPVLAPAAVQHGEAVARAVADGVGEAIARALGR